MKVVKLEFEDVVKLWHGEIMPEKDTAYTFGDLCIALDGVLLDKPIVVAINEDKVSQISLEALEDDSLELLHNLCHIIEENLDHIPQICKLHFDIARHMIQRGKSHSGNAFCDRVVELIKGSFEDYVKTLPNLDDKVLADDLRIVYGWYSTIKSGKQLYKHIGEKREPITLESLEDLAVEIVKEMIKRGFKFSKPEDYKTKSRELWEKVIERVGKDKIIFEGSSLPTNVTEINVDYLKGLNNEELEKLWEWLHNKWKEEFPDGKINEDFLNANILIQMERFNRGLIDYSYKDKDDLDRESRYSWQEYGAVTPLSKRITLEEAIKIIQDNGQIVIKGEPYVGYLCGGIVNRGYVDDQDIDLRIQADYDPRIIKALKEMKPKWFADRLHIFFDKEGGIGYSVPVYAFGFDLVPKNEIKKNFEATNIEYFSSITVGKPVIGLKPKSGFGKNEFFDVKECWTKWGIEHPNSIVEEKVDGRRFQIHIDGDKVNMFSEDTQQDRANLFPEIVAELKSLGVKDAILDGEMLAFELPHNVSIKNASSKRKLGDLIPREDTAVITAGNEIDPEFRKKLVLVIYDMMYLNGKDLTELPYEERRKEYLNLIKDNLKYIDAVNGIKVSNMREFFEAVEKMRRLNGSEGVVIKDIEMRYPVKFSGENRTADACKIKNLKSIDCIVLDAIQKKTQEGKPLPNYLYVSGVLVSKSEADQFDPEYIKEYKGKTYLILGRTYSTDVKCEIGDIITVMPIRIRFYESNGKKKVTWMFPLFKEKREDKKEPDTITTAKRIAEVKTSPLSEDNEIIRIELQTCKYYKDENICPLKRIFRKTRDQLSEIIVEKEHLKYPVKCPLAQLYKCRYLKPYYYEISPFAKYVIETDGELNSLSLPRELKLYALSKYMECPKGEHEFVIESHILTSEYIPKDKHIPAKGSQHLDFRFKVDGYLEGWSIVGGSVDNMVTPTTLIENKAKGFRAEEKAQQSIDWLFPNMKAVGKKVDSLKPNDYVDEMFDVIVGSGEPRGKMFVITRGKIIFGAQKPYFHEYFLKDEEFFKDWTRIVFRAINVPEIDPETKVKTEREDLMWRVMIPEDQMPYAISDRAMEKGWKPPISNPEPFPKDFVLNNFKEQYDKWINWKKTGEFSAGRVVLSVHSYRGPLHVRGMFVKSYYLFLDDGKKLARCFRLNGNPLFEDVFAVEIGRVSKKLMDYEGDTKPESFFNPTKEIVGKVEHMIDTKSDIVSQVEDNIENITFSIKSGELSGKWTLEQEEKGSNVYLVNIANKLSKEGKFAYQKHTIVNDGYHFDLRIDLGEPYLIEFNIPKDLLESTKDEFIDIVKKKCNDKSWLDIEKIEHRKVGKLDTIVEPIDSGTINVLEESEDFMSFELYGNKLRGLFVIKNDTDGWKIAKSSRPRALSRYGEPDVGPYKDFPIEDKKTWDYFRVYLYDPREFTHNEDYKKYIEIEMPEGVLPYIGIYHRLGSIGGARVSMIDFKKDIWSYREAIKWIKGSKLHLWNGVQKRG